MIDRFAPSDQSHMSSRHALGRSRILSSYETRPLRTVLNDCSLVKVRYRPNVQSLDQPVLTEVHTLVGTEVFLDRLSERVASSRLRRAARRGLCNGEKRDRTKKNED
jgi:hypothetical protein